MASDSSSETPDPGRYHWSDQLSDPVPKSAMDFEENDGGGVTWRIHSSDVPLRVAGWWIEPHRDRSDWVTAYRIEPDTAGTPLIVELRIFPAAWLKSGTLGVWGLFQQPPHDVKPITAAQLKRGIFTRGPLDDSREAVRCFVEQNPETYGARMAEAVGWSVEAGREAMREAPRHTGRGGRPDTYYLPVAVSYAEKVRDGEGRENQRVAAELGYTPSQVTDLVRRCRERGLLTPAPGKGKAGGELTEKALELLKEGRERHGER